MAELTIKDNECNICGKSDKIVTKFVSARATVTSTDDTTFKSCSRDYIPGKVQDNYTINLLPS